jgi:hypothetical protein
MDQKARQDVLICPSMTEFQDQTVRMVVAYWDISSLIMTER